MNNKSRKLKMRQMDKKFNEKLLMRDIIVPQVGWLKEIRTTLGMSHSQLANRLKVSAPTVAGYEKREAEGKISIETLRKVSSALNCKLVYAVVPDTSLERIVEDQTLKVAGNIFQKASHTMNLEKQGVDESENKNQFKDLVDEIKFANKKIWDHEI